MLPATRERTPLVLSTLSLSFLLLSTACEPGVVDIRDYERADHDIVRTTLTGVSLEDALDSERAIEAPASFRRIGARWSGPSIAGFEVSTSADGHEWSRWRALSTHHSELEEHTTYAGDLWSTDGERSESFYRLRRTSSPAPARITLEFFGHTTGEDVEAGAELSSFFTQTLSTEPLRYGAAQVRPRAAWNARPARCSSGHSPRRMTLHHTDGSNNSKLSAPAQIRSIQGYHQNTRGWCDIGYHFLVSRDGQLWQGRPVERLGSHAGHGNNTGNVGIALLGSYQDEQPTQAQRTAVAALIRGLSLEFGIPLDRKHFAGHRDMRATDCPGDGAYALLGDLLGIGNGEVDEPPPVPRPDTVRVVGAVYRDGDMGDRIASASVTVNGEVLEVDGFGVYETTVAANTSLVIEVTAPGFDPGRIERLAATDPTWASIGIAETGTTGGSAGLQGVVYQNGNDLDRIGKAVITLDNGRTAVATASGYWRIGNLAPGAYSVTASANGFEQASVVETAESGSFGWASIELRAGGGSGETSGPSCGPRCGSDEPLFDGRNCYCDSLCVKNGDCCDSYFAECR